jgi:protein-tyrosine phosphatase
VIDLHSHILPGVDDGPAELEGALELARAAVADGIELVAATPHVREDYPTSAELMERRLEELRAAVGAAGIALELRPGGELALEELGRDEAELRRFGLGGNADYLLVETPYFGWPLDLGQRLFDLRARGVTPVLAHPERNAEVQANPELLQPLVEAGTLVQITAASVDGRIGRQARASAFELLDRAWVHLLASDAHTPAIRKIGLGAAVDELDDDELGRWLTVEMPRAVVEGGELPSRPQRKRRRRRLRLF